MSARKINHTSPEQQLTVSSRQANLTLSPEAVSIHKGGIEFRSQNAFPNWVEMTVTLKSPQDGATVNCTGVVVDCTGNKHSGYYVSMVFTSMSKQAEARLQTMVYSHAH
ncbi:MAG: PilZ domain-containing protein [Verrucomicrobiota bacterium]